MLRESFSLQLRNGCKNHGVPLFPSGISATGRISSCCQLVWKEAWMTKLWMIDWCTCIAMSALFTGYYYLYSLIDWFSLKNFNLFVDWVVHQHLILYIHPRLWSISLIALWSITRILKAQKRRDKGRGQKIIVCWSHPRGDATRAFWVLRHLSPGLVGSSQ